ncbi:alpha-ketoglutarate-dependent dioxygenase AlkB [Pedobacter petrophilus]|uniref:Alpha-ketoglutarate-dependent dioxygenase AlkB n=1 Tax=Pedobacter petrophilus TaxID=1908241 RepID=A0A7K0FZW8_9SPHI|nr:alpha-ketoglutarate-dependent dioxygenase AlkB [Pedobacter petrophilus]MRX77143.1 alpha-ketoglutarate-dependent dioxygenase AlkB [Pedobacter petrophilus]
MQTLFPLAPILPDGFLYLEDFISLAQEQQLLAAVKALPLHTMIFQGFETKRLVENFGYDYHFDSRKISAGKPIPAAFSFLIELVADFLSCKLEDFQELLVTAYPPGAVINRRRDAPFEMIAGISLSADFVFRLRPYARAKQGRKSTRSLYLLSGVAREEWEHSTMPVLLPGIQSPLP